MNFCSFYLITIIIVALAICSTSTVSAYYLNLEAPAEVRVGQPVVVTGTTNTPPPDRIDIIFSHSVNIPIEIARQPVTITEKGETTFNATFDTTGLEKGNYKVEALPQTQRDFSASSKNLRVVKLTDRSDMIRFSSPSFQDSGNTLVIEARIQDYDDNSIGIEIKLANETLFGPESIPVTRGFVKYELPITKDGKYAITFTDYKGYIGTYHIQVGEETAEKPEPARTTVQKVNDTPVKENITPVETVIETEIPTVTRTPVHEEPTVSEEKTAQPTASPTEKQAVGPASIKGVTVSTMVSRDDPAYLLIQVKELPVTVMTSDNEDWVFEYKTEPKGAAIKVNDQMKKAAEQATISNGDKKIYLKAYPYSFKTGENITITASNADSITLSDEAALAFGATPRYTAVPTGTTKSPAPAAGIILGIIGAVFLARRKNT